MYQAPEREPRSWSSSSIVSCTVSVSSIVGPAVRFGCSSSANDRCTCVADEVLLVVPLAFFLAPLPPPLHAKLLCDRDSTPEAAGFAAARAVP